MQRSHASETAFHHLRRTLSRTVIDILLFGLIGVILGGVTTEAISAALTGSFPTTPTHVAAGVIAMLLGYAMALTVAFRALLRGITQSAEWVVGEVERVAGGVVHEAETVLHIPEDIALASQAATVHASGANYSSMRQPATMIAGIPDDS